MGARLGGVSLVSAGAFGLRQRQAHADDETLQQRFWEIFPTDSVDAYAGNPLHGEIRSRFGAAFLRNNRGWLQ